MTIIDKIEGYHSRLLKAKQLVWDQQLTRVGDSEWRVASSSRGHYTIKDGQCECYDFNAPNGFKWCKHLISIELWKLIKDGDMEFDDIAGDVDVSGDKDRPIEGQQPLAIEQEQTAGSVSP